LSILAGYHPDSVSEKVCDWRKKGCLDQIRFIWKDFRNASYLTAYGEDETGINTFNSMVPGFLEQPTDYYLRPLQQDCSMRYCIGQRITSSYAYDMARNFLALRY